MLARLFLCVAIALPFECGAVGIAGVWQPAGTFNVPRFGHTATLLQDGRVLVAGGQTDCCSNTTAAAEIYDPRANTWTITGAMKLNRAGHLATRLLDGRALVVGGAALANAELYDPVTGTWTLIDGPNTMRGNASLTLLPSGKVLLAGGSGPGVSTFASAELFDPLTATWQATGSMNQARTSHAAALMGNGKVLVAGGLVLNPVNIELPTQLQSAEIYDPSTGQWQQTTRPNRVYLTPAAVALANGRVLVLGDVGDTEYYDAESAAWTITGTRATGHQSYAAAALPIGQVLVAGGYEARTTSYLADAELYDQASGNWSSIAPMLTARSQHTATALANGDVLVVGGLGVSGGQQRLVAGAEIFRASVPGAIGPGYTGAWYDPAQSGQGLMIEVLPENRLLAAWFTFSPGGAQSWFYGVGAYGGNVATIDAVDQPTGGRWIPNFDPAAVVHNAWGSLTITFTDCSHGTVAFSSVAGYGTGSMEITRLTQPAGLQCP